MRSLRRPSRGTLGTGIVIANWNMRYGWRNKPDEPREFEEVLVDVRTLLNESNGELPVQWALGLEEVLTPTEGPNLVERLAAELQCDYRIMPLTDSYDPKEVDANYTGGGWGLAVLTNLPITDGRENPPDKIITDPASAGMRYLGKAPGDPIPRYVLKLPLQPVSGEPFYFQVAHPTHHFFSARGQFKECLCRAAAADKPTVTVADTNTFRLLVRLDARRLGLKVVSPWGPTWPLGAFFRPDSPENNRKRGGRQAFPSVAVFGVDNIVVPEKTVVHDRRRVRLGSDHYGLRVRVSDDNEPRRQPRRRAAKSAS